MPESSSPAFASPFSKPKLEKFTPSPNCGMALMTEDIPQVEILFADDFSSRLRTLAKRYRSIRSDEKLYSL